MALAVHAVTQATIYLKKASHKWYSVGACNGHVPNRERTISDSLRGVHLFCMVDVHVICGFERGRIGEDQISASELVVLIAPCGKEAEGKPGAGGLRRSEVD